MTQDGAHFNDRLTTALKSSDEAGLVELLGGARSGDIAESFELLNDQDRSRVLFALPPSTAAEVIILLDEAVRGDVVDDLDTTDLARIVGHLEPDDAADVLGELEDDEAGRVLAGIDEARSGKIEELLEFDEETAGGIMTPNVVAIPADATVADAVEQVRAASPTEDLAEVYVVDAENKPVGTVPLHRLVTSDPESRISDITEPDIVTVRAQDDQETVVQIIRKYDAYEAAVVDEQGRLLGRITHDDLLDVAEEEAAEDLYRMAGTDAAEFETRSTFRAARVRLTWLLPCMFGMLFSAVVINFSRPHFDLSLFATLVMFVPMIGATGGNSGIQISTVIVRGFASGDLGSMRFARALSREGRIALAMAPTCGLATWAVVSLFLPVMRWIEPAAELPDELARIALAVGMAMCVAILTAAGLGILLPFTFRALKIDPAIASGPIVTTTNDVLSVLVYMVLAYFIAM